MAEPARKLEPVVSTIPDGSKPLKMRWWKCQQTVGVNINQLLTVGGTWTDGVGTTARIKSITLYPGGNVVVELLSGWHDELNRTEDNCEVRYGLVYGGHGVSEGDWK